MRDFIDSNSSAIVHLRGLYQATTLCGILAAFMDPKVDVVTTQWPEFATCLECLKAADKD